MLELLDSLKAHLDGLKGKQVTDKDLNVAISLVKSIQDLSNGVNAETNKLIDSLKKFI